MRHFEGAKLYPKPPKATAEILTKTKTNGDVENEPPPNPSRGGASVERIECFQKQVKRKQN